MTRCICPDMLACRRESHFETLYLALRCKWCPIAQILWAIREAPGRRKPCGRRVSSPHAAIRMRTVRHLTCCFTCATSRQMNRRRYVYPTVTAMREGNVSTRLRYPARPQCDSGPLARLAHQLQHQLHHHHHYIAITTSPSPSLSPL